MSEQLRGNGSVETSQAHADHEQMAAMSPRTLDIPLDPPIEWSNQFFDVLHLREPTFRERFRAEQQIKILSMVTLEEVRNFQIILISMVTGIAKGALELVPVTQFDEAVDFLMKFVKPGHQIGPS